MNVRDWALITFTILAQMAVGSFIVLGIVHFFARRSAGLEEADRLSDRALLAIGPILALGAIVSLLHLGNPLNSYRAISNLGSSWLSREITFNVLFIVVGAAFAFMQWRKLGSEELRNAVAWVAAVVGIALVYSMARVYMLRTQPTWDTIATPLSFFTTTFLLGSLAVGAAFVANHAYLQRKQTPGLDVQKRLMRGALRWLALVAVVLVGVHLVVTPLNLAYLSGSDSPSAVKSVHLLEHDYGLVFALRLILVFAGAAVLGAFIYRNAISPGRESVLGNLAYAAFVLVLIGEVMGRFLFYAVHGNIGL